MNKILLDTLISFRPSLRNSTTHTSSPREFLLIPLILACFAFSPQMQALSPPPDGGYPNGNTAEGDSALSGLTGGFYNSAFGFLSLLSNGDASFNTGIGAGVLLVNTANENTAVGAGALLSTTTGDTNTANGAFALLNNDTGGGNTANGNRALLSNIDGFSNTAVGRVALTALTTGSFNTAVGNQALESPTSGVGNVALGSAALSVLDTGDNNVGLGRHAGDSVTTGSNIIAIGAFQDGVSTTNGQVDDSCYIGNIIGAGVDAGTATLVFVDQDGKLGTTALPNTGVLPGAKPQAIPQRPTRQAVPQGTQDAALNRKVDKLQAVVAQQHKQIKTLTAQLKEQSAQIQKVSAQLEVSKPAAKVVSYEK